MDNPYARRPDCAFWTRAITRTPAASVDPVADPGFRISRTDRIATAGSCFAQHISGGLKERGYNFFVTEPAKPGDEDTSSRFSARFGNIYSVRQLRQLFDRAFGRFSPSESAWETPDGRFLDPYRPRVRKDGFASVDDLASDRESHLAAVRRMFESCDLFIFTLGLTEAWRSTQDGAVFPFAPGAIGASAAGDHEFVNFDVNAMQADLQALVDDLLSINPTVRIILTVSPVGLVATYEPRHVLVSTTYSKAALRVVAEMIAGQNQRVTYFPSYEIITGSYARGAYFDASARGVLQEGVDRVLELFSDHFLADDAAEGDRHSELADILCDEDILDL